MTTYTIERRGRAWYVVCRAPDGTATEAGSMSKGDATWYVVQRQWGR